MMWLVRGMLKWSILVFIWLASLAFATTSTLFMDAISDGLSNVFGITNTHLNHKNTIGKSRSKTKRVATKMVVRNTIDLGATLVPLAGTVLGVGLAAADVYAACELIGIQNELALDLNIPNEESSADDVCSTAVEYVESFPALPDFTAPAWDVPEVFTSVPQLVRDFGCKVFGICTNNELDQDA
ncbi:hypothetical protein N9H49_00935 [Luminiphilus sp.]|nr:hypothetical protein [Luminiphilus sp.]